MHNPQVQKKLLIKKDELDILISKIQNELSNTMDKMHLKKLLKYLIEENEKIVACIIKREEDELIMLIKKMENELINMISPNDVHLNFLFEENKKILTYIKEEIQMFKIKESQFYINGSEYKDLNTNIYDGKFNDIYNDRRGLITKEPEINKEKDKQFNLQL